MAANLPATTSQETVNPPNHEAIQHTLHTEITEITTNVNNSSWAARNLNHPALTPCVLLNAAQKAQVNAQKVSCKLSTEQCKESEAVLTTTIQWLLTEETEKIDAIALKHNVSQEKVKKLMRGGNHYKGNWNVQLANALIYAKA
ncbi:uncharacterized protein EDB91DRAFT_1086484 [Suillus paluster]|uniref:uncharacterized protein n=1 Tax=Suillus paluster TaxID=48578 RepID=UPI001B880554|nr:uncharacterized protein EDB91DRAFT_1086484 [Suillus paluster]KAG1727282.1 hypothetical protein EDB91DRAFT_1086484 [Suillus paluster]